MQCDGKLSVRFYILQKKNQEIVFRNQKRENGLANNLEDIRGIFKT